jgi:hypothetical protein
MVPSHPIQATLSDDERRAIYQALKGQPAGSAFNADIGTEQNSDKIRVQTHNTNAVSQNLKSCALETLRCRVNLARGRAHVGHVLHMAAMNASNWNLALKVFHDRLKIAGKLPPLSRVAFR